MKSVLISIKPKYCELIVSGKKTVEVRKTRPKTATPFKCYIYCTKDFYRKGDGYFQGKCCGKVIGEFVCDKITEFYPSMDLNRLTSNHIQMVDKSCVNMRDLYNYANDKILYAWQISDIVIYDKPKELSEFRKYKIKECWYADLGLAKRDCPDCKDITCFVSRPPQSWCYVEGLRS